jgi:hypothetical protein
MAARQEAGSHSLKNSVVSRQLSEIEAANRGTVATIGPNVARFLVNKDALIRQQVISSGSGRRLTTSLDQERMTWR